MKEIIIIGGGASGLMAAVAAARAGAKVTVLEANEKPLKKLLVTGNGRCNLSNTDFSRPDCYRGGSPEFVRTVLKQFSPEDTLKLFEEMGLFLTEKQNGGIYPLTDKASDAADILLLEAARLRVKIKCTEKVTAVFLEDGKWHAATDSWCYRGDALILACGSKAFPSAGASGSGYLLAEGAGHGIVPVLPALVPLMTREKWVRQLTGLRSRCSVTMKLESRDGTKIYREAGELQWTDYGISGIVIFQLSRYAGYALEDKEKVTVELDLLPSLMEEQLFCRIRAGRPGSTIAENLTGILPVRLNRVILDELKIRPGTSSAAVTDGQIREIVYRMKHLQLTVTGTRSFDMAQICCGGVDTAQVDPHTMESYLRKGLYITGELLDVDGICGGYNLQWAWSTGYTAGIHSADKEEKNDQNFQPEITA